MGLGGRIPFVHKAPDDGEESRKTLDFIENDEFSCVAAEIKFRIRQFGQVRRAFQIKVMNSFCEFEFSGKRSFSDLPGTEQSHNGHPLQALQESGEKLSGDHLY